MLTNNETLVQYHALGFDTLPLYPGTKKAIKIGWPNIPSDELWQEVPENANIGIRAGGKVNLAIIDCDEKTIPGTFRNIENWLDGIGYGKGSYPIVQTASGNGRHVYIRFIDNLTGSIKNLSEAFGAGEFRFSSGAYVVAPPSIVDNQQYQVLIGDFHQLPKLCNADVMQLLKKHLGTESRVGNDFKKTPRIPNTSLLLLKGSGIENYPSRSEADEAIIIGLINAGFDFEGVHNLFLQYPTSGKFLGLDSKHAFDYLNRSYASANEYALTHESKGRQAAWDILNWAIEQPWSGKTGQYDKMVFIAHAKIAYNACRLQYNASGRQLADLTNISHGAALKATYRLCKANFIQLVMLGVEPYASIYRLRSQSKTPPPSAPLWGGAQL